MKDDGPRGPLLFQAAVVMSLGLYDYKARLYSPTTWAALADGSDPIGTKDDLNLYAYVKNNPVNFRDPTKLIVKTLSSGKTSRPV